MSKEIAASRKLATRIRLRTSLVAIVLCLPLTLPSSAQQASPSNESPEDYITFYNRGVDHFLKGRYDKALIDYSEAIRIYPGLAAAYNNRCHTRAVIGRELEMALADCDEALRLVPENETVRDTRGFLYLKMADYPKAILEYNAALRIEPNQARAFYGRGYARTKMGEKAAGDADIAAALNLDTGIAEEYARGGVK